MLYNCIGGLSILYNQYDDANVCRAKSGWDGHMFYFIYVPIQYTGKRRNHILTFAFKRFYTRCEDPAGKRTPLCYYAQVWP